MFRLAQIVRTRRFNSATIEDIKTRKIAILFPGQGSQFVGMGQDIYNEYEAARIVFDEAEETLGLKLKDLMFEGPQSSLTATANAQPAILCHSIALLRVMEQNFEFDISLCRYAMGHSLGEYSALVATNSISLAEALKLVRKRGEAMQNIHLTKPFAMKALMVHGDNMYKVESLVHKLATSLPIGELVEIANINSSSQVVLSGTQNGVDYAASILNSKGYAGRGLPLPVSAPFHCSLMLPAAESLGEALENLEFRQPSIEVLSNVTGRPIADADDIPQLLKKQVVQTVQWQKCMQYAKYDCVFDWLVVGPSRVLANIVKKEYRHDNIMYDELIRDISTIKDLKKFKF